MKLERPVPILYMITDSGVGGTEKMLRELILRIDRRSFTPALAVLKRPGEMAHQVREAGVTVYSLGLPAEITPRYFLAMAAALPLVRRIMQEVNPVIIHSFLFQANMIARFAARLCRVPINISSIRVMEKERRSHAPLDRATSFLVTRYTAVSEEVKNHTVCSLDVPREKVVVVPNGIDLGPFLELDPWQVREELHLDAAAPLIGSAGRLTRQKGHDILIRAMPAMLREVPGLYCLIVGQGPEMEALKRLTRELRLEERVIFTGQRSDIPHLMAALDIFGLPSRWEGMPNALLEAMAARRPVVASAVGGCLEVVVHGETGVLVPPEDIAALARTITELLKQPAKAQALGLAGRRRVEQEFRLETMVQKNQALYLELLHELESRS